MELECKVNDAEGMQITLIYTREFKIRMTLGVLLMRLACWIMKCQAEIKRES